MDTTDEIFPEDRELIEKLARLQDMHGQIQHLRGLMPERLLKPAKIALTNPRNSSPEEVAADLKKAASNGSRDIQRFKKDFNSPEMRDLWQTTSTSELGQGRDVWTIDYQALLSKSKVAVVASDAYGNAASTINNNEEDAEAVIKQFRDGNDKVQIESRNQPNTFPIDVNVSGLSFQITKQEHNGKRRLCVEKAPNSKESYLQTQIIEQVKASSGSSSLQVLLSMLASYHDLKFRSCDTCQNIFDGNMNYPIVRRQRPKTDADSTRREWMVLHRSCNA